MRAIINRKRYDTETATFVASWDNGFNYNDFCRVDERLFRTPRGNWFLYGVGGASTEYRKQIDSNAWRGGSRITPYTPAEAYAWLELHGKVDEIEEYFSTELEDA